MLMVPLLRARLTWTGSSAKSLMPAHGWTPPRKRSSFKLDYVAIKLEFRLRSFPKVGYLGQKSYEEATTTNPLDVAIAYQAWRDQHLASWSTARPKQDVEELWAFYYRLIGAAPLSIR
eukprot:625203-Amphidinium_carterae.4